MRTHGLEMGLKKYDFYVQKGRPLHKIFLDLFASHVGLLILLISYAVAGEITLIGGGGGE